jgi:protein-disulfide isomerase
MTSRFSLALAGCAVLLLLAAAARPALAAHQPATNVSEIKDIDFTGLSEGQKKIALRLMNSNPCNCGCDMPIAACRRDMKSPCRRSLIFARTVVDAIREGKDEPAVLKVLQAKTAAFVEPKLPDDAGVVYTIDVINAPVRGPKTAPVRIVEFSDFQCPFCAELQKTLDQVLKAFPKEVQLVYKQYPLNIHIFARQAAAASLVAHAQGKFWELHDRMFQNFSNINDETIRQWAKEVGLNMTEFDKVLQSGRMEAAIQKDMADGASAKVLGTPTVFVNGKRIHDRSFDGFKKVIQEELANLRTASATGDPAAAKGPAKSN